MTPDRIRNKFGPRHAALAPVLDSPRPGAVLMGHEHATGAAEMDLRESFRRNALWWVLGATGVVMIALAGLALGHYEVVAKGQLLSYTEGRIYQVRFFDRFDLLVEPEHRLSADAVTAYFLTGIAFIALAFAWLLHRMGPGSAPRMFALIFLGASYLAADEYLGLHESIGHNLPFLLAIPGVSRPDDVVIALYAIPAAAFLWFYRAELTLSVTALRLVGLAFALFAVATVADFAGLPGEELIEGGAALIVVVAMIEVGVAHADLAYRSALSV